MSTQLTTLLHNARTQQDITPETFNTIKQVAAYTRPDMDDANQAVALGRKEGVEALLRSPKLAPDERIAMATQMLHTFSKDPLAAPRQSEMLTSLLAEGANVQATDQHSKTPLDYIVERLKRMTEAEQALSKDGRPRHPSGAGVRMRQLRDEIAKNLPLGHRSRVDVAEFEAGLARPADRMLTSDVEHAPKQRP